MSDLTAPRDHLLRALEADLIGPFRRGLKDKDGNDGIDSVEELRLPPSRWYLTGFLVPEGAMVEDEESQEELAQGNDETEEETGGSSPEAKKKNFLPASMGLTVFVPKGVKRITAIVRYADYDRAEEADRSKAGKAKYQRNWTRVPMPDVSEELDLTDGSLEGDGIAVRDARGLRLIGQVEPLQDIAGIDDGTQAVSVFLVNRRAADGPGFRDRAYAFQVELELHCEQGFFGRPDLSGKGSKREPDDRIGDLQYRNVLEYAVGHGVSVAVPSDQERVTRVRTCWLPRHEVRRVIAREEPQVTVAMERLAELTSPDEVYAQLKHLPEAYRAWIAAQAELDVGDDDRKQAQAILLKRANDACDRIAAGIDILATQEDVREAFCLANRAMASAARKRRPESEPRWRLFQLAFVLLNLSGLADPTHPDRQKAELIFFPTGGGKTEAYLGVIATTLVLRRLRAKEAAHRGLGVAVILRYTLRLLTLDQLGRAATLICALELLRRDDPRRLGPERFSVGLWVGSSATANTMTQVKKAVIEFQGGTGGNPAPLVDCPWCGTELGPGSLMLLANGKRTATDPDAVRIACLDDTCEFCAAKHEDGIPVLFVDEHVYRELPSFLIGTVDKFAMVPWRGETGKLFGKVTGRKGRHFYNATDGSTLPKGATPLPEGNIPPELIVQDELHLISGPLGTMVGLYETAIDFLCRQQIGGKSIPPKVIAATATVRRATEQMCALYGRTRTDVSVFPPPAVDAMDTYFSHYAPSDEPGRLYIGVAAPGRSMKVILLRTYRCLLAAGLRGFKNGTGDEATRDAYTTLAGYFNSLRELGGMRRIAEDDLIARSAQAEAFKPEGWKGEHPWFANRKLNDEPVELTSRESTMHIKQSKDRLGNGYGKPDHVDVLLASNMISVGVDIDRLGLMVVAGQPKTTAEYIQASSRVGRQANRPGLVVTCMNVHKPRDRSHFERFDHYHAAFYRMVEATSVTPYSGPALDRGLAGTLVSMVRFLADDMTPAAGVMEIEKHKAELKAAVEALATRASRQPSATGETEASELIAQVRKRAVNLLETWELLVKSNPEEPVKRRYSRFDKDKSGGEPLLKLRLDDNAPDPRDPEGRFFAPTSMREVEKASHLWVQRFLGPYEGPRKGDK